MTYIILFIMLLQFAASALSCFIYINSLAVFSFMIATSCFIHLTIAFKGKHMSFPKLPQYFMWGMVIVSAVASMIYFYFWQIRYFTVMVTAFSAILIEVIHFRWRKCF